jgi:hypothetical protein
MRAVLRSVLTLCVLIAFGGASRAADVPSDLSVVRATLSNGLKVIVVRDPLAPVVTALLNYKAGSNDQSIKGQAHALEHMMFRGSPTLSQSQLADVAELLGGNWDADTQAEVTQYFFTAPSKYLDLLLRMEASTNTSSPARPTATTASGPSNRSINRSTRHNSGRSTMRTIIRTTRSTSSSATSIPRRRSER